MLSTSTSVPALKIALEPLAYTMQEAAAVARLHRDSLYRAARAERLRVRKEGRKTLILREDLIAYLRALPEGLDGPPAEALAGQRAKRRADLGDESSDPTPER